jgi:hypothetical protein
MPTEAAVTAAQIAKALRKCGAAPEDMILADAEHPSEARGTLRRLGAPADLLEIVGSIGESMDDRSVVDKLRH